MSTLRTVEEVLALDLCKGAWIQTSEYGGYIYASCHRYYGTVSSDVIHRLYELGYIEPDPVSPYYWDWCELESVRVVLPERTRYLL